ncbi:MAG: NDP-sugar synthase [Candidatus Margulisbacteria bacterium]|nr:NDP-sugar synthase [Candidatus Margulisiibacteriota bacterium]
MKALILAAGYGKRLEPLTIAVPKPMAPIVNLPTMQHNIELLKKHGLTEIIANIHYHPEQIENYFGDGNDFGVSLSYSYEEELLGTAGGVKKMAELAGGLNETFLVLSSDALTDINLTSLVEHHKEKKALVTIALSKVEDIRGFGVVLQDEAGRITGFQEKPEPADALSDLVNTGIYVFEPEILAMIPDGFHDFGHELFPKLVKTGANVHGFQLVGYWNDVGSLEKYIRSNYDALSGSVQIIVPGKKVSSAHWVGERENIDPLARFEGSVIIGDRCRIGRDVYIKDSVIGDKCVISDGAVVTGSVLWSDTSVARRAQVVNSVVGSFCYIGAEAKVNDQSVIANRTIIRGGMNIPAGTKLPPNSTA